MHYGGSRPANPRVEDTPALRDLDLDDYAALVVCGGQAPMFQFREHADLKAAIARFYEARKPTRRALPRRVKAFAVRDMNLITGQQQYSGKGVAELVIEGLGD